jgi:predicted alpha-1,2-mannosidase
MTPWNCQIPSTILDQCYYDKGFFPALKNGEQETLSNVNKFERRQAVSVTLEHCFDDWCTAQLAKALGKEDDYQLFIKRASNWKTLYDPKLGLFAPKDMDGNWIKDFEPMLAGGQGGRDYYAENNAYTWQWSVPHDYKGLFEAMGGVKKAEEKLDILFTVGCDPTNKYVYMAQFPDSTGLMGQFCMGNEPSFNTPYIYDYMGVPWKTQKRLRDLMDIWFINSPIGICGDEDQGAMSAWIAFSSLGFYPVCSGTGEYALGTPLFDSASIDVGGRKVFTIRSPGAGDGKRYIQSAVLNGKPLGSPFIAHRDIAAGGELTMVMGDAPNFKAFAGA